MTPTFRAISPFVTSRWAMLSLPATVRGARDFYQKALPFAPSSVAADGADVQYRRDLALTHERLAGLAAADGAHDDARASLRKAFALREQNAATDPDNAAWQIRVGLQPVSPGASRRRAAAAAATRAGAVAKTRCGGEAQCGAKTDDREYSAGLGVASAFAAGATEMTLGNGQLNLVKGPSRLFGLVSAAAEGAAHRRCPARLHSRSRRRHRAASERRGLSRRGPAITPSFTASAWPAKAPELSAAPLARPSRCWSRKNSSLQGAGC